MVFYRCLLKISLSALFAYCYEFIYELVVAHLRKLYPFCAGLVPVMFYPTLAVGEYWASSRPARRWHQTC
jgi:hypothetical protein